MSEVEEFFINDSDDAIPSKPKIYASSYKTIAVNNLIQENLQQILNKKERFSNKLEEKIHYLQLDLANRELELMEAREYIEKQKNIIELLNKFEDSFKIIKENKMKYQELIKMFNEKTKISYIDGVEKYIEISKTPPPFFYCDDNILPPTVGRILLELNNERDDELYRIKRDVQEFIIDYNARDYRHILYFLIISGTCIVLSLFLYLYLKW